jgi:hypothetical protein
MDQLLSSQQVEDASAKIHRLLSGEHARMRNDLMQRDELDKAQAGDAK